MLTAAIQWSGVRSAPQEEYLIQDKFLATPMLKTEILAKVHRCFTGAFVGF